MRLKTRTNNSPEHENPTKPRFRFSNLFRFRLRTLLLVVTIFGVVVGPELYWQIGQRNAARLLRSTPSTTLAYDYEIEAYDHWKDKFPPVRSKVAKIAKYVTGSDFLNPVIWLFLADDSEYLLNLVSKLRHLKWLQIAKSTGSLRDRAIVSLKPLDSCTQLEYLVIGSWLLLTPDGSEGFRGTGRILLPYDISDSDLRTIGRLNKLRVLAIGGQFVTDESLMNLSELKSLEFLYLSRANVSQTGIQHLQRALPKVKITELVDANTDYSSEIISRF